MSHITQYIALLLLSAILAQFLKPYPLRKWLGLALVVVGVVGIFTGSKQQVLGFDLELLMLMATPLGVGLFVTRRWFTDKD